MVAFLARHFQSFSTCCKLPSAPSLTLSLGLQKTVSATPPGNQSVLPSRQGGTADSAHLTAAGTELTVVWYKPFLPELKLEGSSDAVVQTPADPITGLFALNLKPIKSHPPSNIGSAELEVHVVRTSASALTELYNSWEELAEAAKAYLDARSIARPISRSQSRQRRMSEKFQKTPLELQVGINMCIMVIVLSRKLCSCV